MQATQPTPDPLDPQQVLAELVRMGLDIARTLHARITALSQDAAPEAAPEDPAALAAAFDRISRTVRRTLLLAEHLAHPTPRPDPARTEAQALARARRHVLRAVENKITRNDDPVENPDALRRELLERVEGPDLQDELLTRPLPDIIGDLCNDMGLDRWPFAPPFPRRTPRDIARLAAQANGTADPAASPWTHSGPTRLAPPRGKPDAHGITPGDRALHAHIMGTARQPPRQPR